MTAVIVPADQAAETAVRIGRPCLVTAHPSAGGLVVVAPLAEFRRRDPGDQMAAHLAARDAQFHDHQETP